MTNQYFTLDASMVEPYKALYIHVPFCKSKCHYCDFFSKAVSPNDPEISEYADSIVEQIFKLGRKGDLSDIETVYIGGGTPSFLGSKYLTSIMYSLGLSMNLTDDIEVTLEANPESFDERLSKDLYALGVNRISFGVQSFNDELLEKIGRAHTANDAIKSIDIAKDRFENISIDLMCGLPGQTIGDFKSDIERAVELNVQHISVYPLAIEQGTKMDDFISSGIYTIPDEDDIAEMMELAHNLLTQSGFEHYEVSNFAKPGHRSKHNTAYWSGIPYLGIGPGAVGMSQKDGFRIRESDGEVVDELSGKQVVCENLILSMRTSDGVKIELIRELDGTEGFSGIRSTFEDLINQGFVEYRDDSYVPTLKGYMMGNVIYERLLDYF